MRATKIMFTVALATSAVSAARADEPPLFEPATYDPAAEKAAAATAPKAAPLALAMKDEKRSFLATAKTEERGTPWMMSLGLAGACAAALALALVKKKRNDVGETIKILSSRALGPKIRLMLVEARGRELLLSVGDKNAELILEWPTADAEPAEIHIEEPVVERELEEVKPRASSSNARPSPAKPEPKEEAQPGSAAVAGLLRLKKSPQQKKAAPELERSDLFAAWSRHLIDR